MAERDTYHHGRLREALIACGIQILDEQGIGSLTLRSVTRAAGVSPGAPRHEFGDLNGLLSAIAVQGLSEMTQLRKMAVLAESTAVGRLKAVMRVYVDFAVQRPGMFWVMVGPGISDRHLRPDVAKAAQGSYLVLEQHVYAYLMSFNLGRACTAELVQCAWSAVHGVSMLFSGRPHGPSVAAPMPFIQWRESVLDFALAGLRTRGQEVSLAATPDSSIQA